MKKTLFVFLLIVAGMHGYSQKIPYTNCTNCWAPDSLGNHRAVIDFTGTGQIAKVIIPWRRRDLNPENKRVIIQDAKTLQKITNVKLGALNRESGEIFFEPISGSGQYYV